jgi:hypothetical protein
MTLYQCLLLGAPSNEQVAAFSHTFAECLGLFNLEQGCDYSISRGVTNTFNEATATVGVYFGCDNPQYPELQQVSKLSIPVVPVVSAAVRVKAELPEALWHINALISDPCDSSLRRVVSSALQCLGLLPAQRRVFVSYRREESADVALQLFETLSARHFDVFLDTHSISVAAEFQSALWHRLCDSDVLVMLDTPRYFNSRWTSVEWGRAVAKHISIVQVVWPDHQPSRNSRLATLKKLSAGCFDGKRLTADVLAELALEVEEVRSRSVALRHANLVGTLRSAVEDLGGVVEGIGQRRSVLLKLPSGVELVAYPVVGVPTSLDVHESIGLSDKRTVALVYDHLGISDDWIRHMDWLATEVGTVKWIRSREADWQLADLGM